MVQLPLELLPWQATIRALPKYLPGAQDCMIWVSRWPIIADPGICPTGCVLICEPRVLRWIDHVADRETAQREAKRKSAAAERRKGRTQTLTAMFAGCSCKGCSVHIPILQ